jgi:hypothetical protein
MTADEIGKATTPNALCEASTDRLDDITNHAHSLLLGADAGTAHQLQAALQAIHAEKARRYSRKPKWIEWAILFVTAIGVVVAILERPMMVYVIRYLPFAAAIVCCIVMISARLLTNRHVNAHRAEIVSAGTSAGNIPPVFSVLYLVGLFGLIASGIWGFLTVAWWAIAVAVVLYLLTGLVRSELSSLR